MTLGATTVSDGFADFVTARSPRLLRTAYLLTQARPDRQPAERALLEQRLTRAQEPGPHEATGAGGGR